MVTLRNSLSPEAAGQGWKPSPGVRSRLESFVWTSKRQSLPQVGRGGFQKRGLRMKGRVSQRVPELPPGSGFILAGSFHIFLHLMSLE